MFKIDPLWSQVSTAKCYYISRKTSKHCQLLIFQRVYYLLVSISVSAQAGIVALGKAHTCSTLSLSSLLKVALKTVPMFVRLNTDRSQPCRVECRPLPFLTSLFLQVISAVMLWPIHVQKVPQALEHLCPAKLQTRCDICCACQSICPFIPTDSNMPMAVDPKKSLQLKTVHGCVPIRATHSRLHLCSRLIESVRMMACVICASHWEASHCLAYVTASTSRIRLEVVTLWAPLSLCTFARKEKEGRREKKRKRDRQTDRQTDRQRQRERMCMWMSVRVCVCVCVGVCRCVCVCM